MALRSCCTRSDGANGAGDVNIGGGGDGTGFNMASMMASMAVGGAVGQNIAGAMNHMMGGIQQPVQSGMTPPPIPRQHIMSLSTDKRLAHLTWQCLHR